MCSAAGGTMKMGPAKPDPEIPHSSFLIPNSLRYRSAWSSSSPALASRASVTRLPPVIRASSAFRCSRSSSTTRV